MAVSPDETTDNPGWFLQFDFYDLEVGVSKEIEANNFRNSDRDFVTFVYDEKKSTLTIACGILNLGQALELLTFMRN